MSMHYIRRLVSQAAIAVVTGALATLIAGVGATDH